MEVPDLTGKVAIVTGSNTGIGEVTARELARAGARVHLACRSAEKATQALARIRTEVPDADLHFLRLDLGSLAKVRAAADEFLALGQPLHLLVNNAGIAARGETDDGFEITFGVNHLGPFLFTLSLLPRLVESAPARVVNVASKAHYRAKEIPFERARGMTKTTSGFDEYSYSKLANVLFTSELHRRLEGTGVTTYALHPGVVATDIWRRIPWPFRSLIKLRMIGPEEGARTSLHCATAADIEEFSGQYFDECEVRKPSRTARDADLAAELWRRSLEWTGAPDFPSR